jgi:outer membrane biosynthesis protein TonB
MMNFLILLIINIAILAVMFIYLKLSIRKELVLFNPIEKMEKDVDSLMLAINETTDKNIDLLEEKISETKAFIEKLEERLKLLNKELLKSEAQENYVKAAPKNPNEKIDEKPKLKEKQDPSRVKHQKTYEELGTKHVKQQRLFDIETEIKTENKKAENSNMRDKVIELYKQGHDIKSIASQLQLPAGEVELILSLQRSQIS